MTGFALGVSEISLKDYRASFGLESQTALNESSLLVQS